MGRFLRATMRPIERLALLCAASALLLSACGDTSQPSPSPTRPSAPARTQPDGQSQPVQALRDAPRDIAATTPSRVEYLDPVPMSRLVSAQRGPVRADREVSVPIITWGGDVATIYANGGVATQHGSIFAGEGLSVRLFREDNFIRSVERLISGETPYLRGTVDMVNSAVEAVAEHGIELVVIYQMTWSTGGDTIVMRTEAGSAPAELRGKEIGTQLFGPHMLYLATVLGDSGIELRDVRIRWLRELTIPPYDTGGVAVDPTTAMQRDASLAAVTVISPDMLALTSGGMVGTGAESSVRGAKLLLSTKTAGAIIADVYAVRKDYFDAQRDQVRAFVQGLLKGQEELNKLLADRQARQAAYQEILRLSAEILRDSPQATADIEGLIEDCTFVGLQGNQQFFTGEGTLRSFATLTQQAQEALIGFGLLSRPVGLGHAGWSYPQLALGLEQPAPATTAQRFDPGSVERLSRERELAGRSREGVLFEFEIFFAPNQNEFALDQYRGEFGRVLNLASTYPGAVVVVEGHADPLKYVQERQAGRPQAVLDQTKQAAKNLSVQRAITVRDSLVAFGGASQINLDTSQFSVVGAGIDRPKHATPNTESEWRANMRVVFQIIQVEAELERFSPR